MTCYQTHREMFDGILMQLSYHGLKFEKVYYNKKSVKFRDLTCEYTDVYGEALVVARELLTTIGITQVNVVNRFKHVSASRAFAFGEKEHLVSMTVHFD